MCCLCFEMTPNEYATWDVNAKPWVLVDVCITCRMHETYWMIRKWSEL